MWPGAPSPTAETILTISHDGFYNRLLTFTEHTGTHFDAPCHMLEGAQSVDQVDASRLVRPVAVIDVSEDMAGDPDSILTLAQVQRFEEPARPHPGRVGGLPAHRLGGRSTRTPRATPMHPGRCASPASVPRLPASSSRSVLPWGWGRHPGYRSRRGRGLRGPSPDQPPARRLAPRGPHEPRPAPAPGCLGRGRRPAAHGRFGRSRPRPGPRALSSGPVRDDDGR